MNKLEEVLQDYIEDDETKKKRLPDYDQWLERHYHPENFESLGRGVGDS